MPRPGDVGRAPGLDGKPGRPAVVLKIVSDDELLAIVGTGTRRNDYDHVEISPRERTGIVLRLTKPTYFYKSGIAVVKVSAFEAFPGRCTPERFIALSALNETGEPVG